MMVLGSVSAIAAEGNPTGSITVKPSSTVTLSGKTLKAYKILDATYSGTGDDQAVAYSIPAGMVNFFDGYSEFKGTEATASAAAAKAGKTLNDFVTNIMKDWGDNSEKIKDFEYAALAAAKVADPAVTVATGAADGNNVKFANLNPGYYVIEDEGTKTPISALMLDTVTDANVEITLKAEDKSDKKLKTAGGLTNERADELGLGRPVNYIITNEIPNTTGYTYMYYMINDTLHPGLTFNPDTVVVKVTKPAVGTEGEDGYQAAVTTTLTKDTDYYLYHGESADSILNGKTFIIAFKDVVTSGYGGYGVEVTYTATVNSNAVVGVNPNTNKVNVEYSNNPDKDERHDKENFPGIPANTTDTPTGVGPDKWTDTYTTKITILKKDGATNEALPGVEFTLTGTGKDVVANAEDVFEINEKGTYWLLKNGKYTTDAPQTETTLRETTGDAGWVQDDSATGSNVRFVNSKKYRPYVKSTDSALTRYIIVEPNDAAYASTTIKYEKVRKTADAEESYNVLRSGITAATTGELSFAQLGAGTYTLTETGILDGYNGIKEIPFTVTCTLPDADDVDEGNETATWNITTDAPGVTFTPGTGDNLGTFTITIANNKGVELPSTGGIGTTIFYVAGSILVLAAAILLITKRRMGAND